MIWTDVRLQRLYHRYRMRYWPRSRRLRQFRVENVTLKQEHAFGFCDYDAHVLKIDAAAHRSDREVRSTVLHEMIHAVLGRSGHAGPFWTQLEYLLKRDAPKYLDSAKKIQQSVAALTDVGDEQILAITFEPTVPTDIKSVAAGLNAPCITRSHLATHPA